MKFSRHRCYVKYRKQDTKFIIQCTDNKDLECTLHYVYVMCIRLLYYVEI